MKYINIIILILFILSTISSISGIKNFEYKNGITTIEYFSGYSRLIPILLATLFGVLFYIFYKRFEIGYIVGWIALTIFYILALISFIIYAMDENGITKIILVIFSTTAVTFLFGYWAILWKKQKNYFNVNLN